MKLSVITVCYNANDCLEKTILSVINQSYTDIEYIIIDGASSDGTIDIIKKYESKISSWISEKDNGIYDAMNKGIELAKGDVLYFLNAGDTYIHNMSLEKTMEKINTLNCEGIYLTKGVNFCTKTGKSELINYNHKINPFFLYYNSICQQSFFVHRKTFEKHGSFDTTYKLKGDMDWFVKSILKYKTNLFYLDTGVVLYIEGGVSATLYNKYGRDESVRIKNTYFSKWQKLLFNKSFLFITRRIF